MPIISPLPVEHKICFPQYVSNQLSAKFDLNAIPIKSIPGGWEIYFPRPFQIMGLCKSPLLSIPELGLPAWPMVNAFPETPINQATYSDMTPLLMLELARATMFPFDETGSIVWPVEYVGAGIQGTDYRGYFVQYLNDQLTITEPGQFLNTFMMPANLWKRFADLNGGATADAWYDKFREFILFAQRTANQRLYGSPGIYRLLETSSVFEWILDSEYTFIVEG